MAFDSGEWKPTIKQELFLSIPLTVKEAAYGGGAGSAKTDVLLVYALIHRWHEHPGFKQVFMRRTFPELRNEIIPRSRQIYSKFGATLNRSDMAWTFPRPDQLGGTGMSNAGAMIFLGQCENENDVHKYDSMEINLFTPDELTSFTEYIYLYIGFTRTRTSHKELPAIIRTAGMPGGIGHTWVKKRFVDPAPPPNDRKIIIGRGGNKRIYIHATVLDNPHIDPSYLQGLYALPEAEKKAKLGDWSSYQGQVFDEFRDRNYPDEPANAVHVIEPFTIPDWWPKFVVGDWGFAAMTWIGYAAVSPNKRVYLYREQTWTKVKIEEWAPLVKDYIDRETPRVVKFCKSAGQDRGQEHTIEQQISAALGRPIELTTNSAGSRISGKQLLHEYLRWKPKPLVPQDAIEPYNEERAMWLLRNRTQREYKAYVNQYNTEPVEEVIPKLQIFNTCPALIEAIKAASYDKKKVEDVAEFSGDDPYDGIRYVVDTAEQFFESAKEEFAKVQKQEQLVQQLNNTQDYTAFYRNSRRLESDGTNGLRPVRTFHRRR